MPTILRKDGFEVIIYTNDHPPPHVHIFRASAEVVITLGNRNTPPSVRENLGMSRKDERKALIIVAERQDSFRLEWRRIHGNR